jgi:hypothetical protein
MRGANVFLLAAAAVVVPLVSVSVPVRAQEPSQSPDQKQFPEEPPLIPAPSLHQPGISGPIIPDEDLWTAHLSDEPQKQAKAAVEALTSGDLKNAREDVLKLASHVYIAADRSEGQARKILIASLDELRKTADAIQASSLSTPKPLAPVLARALQALSYHHAIKASEKWLNRKEIPAGYELQAAELDYRDALDWMGREPDAAVATILNDAHDLSVRLIREETIGDREVTLAITGLTRKAQDLGDSLRGVASTS